MSSNMAVKAASSSKVALNTSHDVDETPLRQLLSVSMAVLSQALHLVETVLTSDEQLTVHSKHLPGSTIGSSFQYVV
jgi:hypothetical protein